MKYASKIEALALIEDGQNLFNALVLAFDGAQALIHLETYIFDFYGAGQSVAEALVRAASRGVVVRVMVDGDGTKSLSLQ